MPRKRNPQFTTDEAQTATLLGTEGSCGCHPVNAYRYPRLAIRVCDKELLEPASRVLEAPIRPVHYTHPVCKPHLFPPEGKGTWEISKTGKPAEQKVERLKPLLTQEFLRKWKKTKEECH